MRIFNASCVIPFRVNNIGKKSKKKYEYVPFKTFINLRCHEFLESRACVSFFLLCALSIKKKKKKKKQQQHVNMEIQFSSEIQRENTFGRVFVILFFFVF